jgi:hypothetical protein
MGRIHAIGVDRHHAETAFNAGAGSHLVPVVEIGDGRPQLFPVRDAGPKPGGKLDAWRLAAIVTALRQLLADGASGGDGRAGRDDGQNSDVAKAGE